MTEYSFWVALACIPHFAAAFLTLTCMVSGEIESCIGFDTGMEITLALTRKAVANSAVIPAEAGIQHSCLLGDSKVRVWGPLVVLVRSGKRVLSDI